MDIWLTKDGSKRTNNVLQSTQPTTSRLIWQSTNNIASSSTNQANDPRLKHLLLIHDSLDSDNADFRRGCRNETQCHHNWLCYHKQSFSGLHSPSRTIDHNLPTYDMTPGFKPCNYSARVRSLFVGQGSLSRRWRFRNRIKKDYLWLIYLNVRCSFSAFHGFNVNQSFQNSRETFKSHLKGDWTDNSRLSEKTTYWQKLYKLKFQFLIT